MANSVSVNWEEAPSFFAPLKGPYSLSLWLITLCQFLFCRPEGRVPPPPPPPASVPCCSWQGRLVKHMELPESTYRRTQSKFPRVSCCRNCFPSHHRTYFLLRRSPPRESTYEHALHPSRGQKRNIYSIKKHVFITYPRSHVLGILETSTV